MVILNTIYFADIEVYTLGKQLKNVDARISNQFCGLSTESL